MNRMTTSGDSPVVLDWLDPSSRIQMAALVQIDRQIPDLSWTLKEIQTTAWKNQLVRIASIGEKIVGFMVFRLFPGGREIVRIGVDEPYRRQRVGATLVEWLKRQLGDRPSVKQICVLIPASELVAQQFFRSQGFRHYRTFRCEHCGEEFYALRCVKVESECCDRVGEALELCA